MFSSDLSRQATRYWLLNTILKSLLLQIGLLIWAQKPAMAVDRLWQKARRKISSFMQSVGPNKNQKKHHGKRSRGFQPLHYCEATRVKLSKAFSNRRLYKPVYQRASTPVFTPCNKTLPAVLMPLLATFPVVGSTVAAES